jgi:hypothetical protein
MKHTFVLISGILLTACGYTMGLGPDGCPAPTPQEAELTKSVWQ